MASLVAYTFTDVVVAWPLAFLLGVVVGLLAATRYRLTRAPRNGGSVP